VPRRQPSEIRAPSGPTPPATALDAATIVLVRDAPGGADGLEALLVERHAGSDVAAGALVFPGGKVSPTDRVLDGARWTGAPLARWQGQLQVATPAHALGLLVAAVRETFEEAGVLLARREDGSAVSADDLSSRSFRTARRELSVRGTRWDWRRWLEDEALVLDLGALALWSWWVSPQGVPHRFDTRFFVATLPVGQVAHQDGTEITALRWMRPGEALDAAARDEAIVMFPTRRNLLTLGTFRTAAAAWQAAARGEVDQRRVQPRIGERDGRAVVEHPLDGTWEPL
jgi:8-oxo-dGTP pyrophosphatase MutT (NUDIX family)